MAEQLPFIDVGLATNPQQRCPCVLLLDVSDRLVVHIEVAPSDVRFELAHWQAASAQAQELHSAVPELGARGSAGSLERSSKYVCVAWCSTINEIICSLII